MSSINLSAISPWAVVALCVLAVVEVILDVIAMVDLYRRPAADVVFGNKWIWVVIVLLVNTVGAIVYLVVARKPAILPEGATALPQVRSQDIADALYGPREDPEQKR